MESDSRFVVGLIGAGSMAEVHARCWQRAGAEVLVFAPTRGQDLAGRLDCRWASSLAEVLNRSDAIDVCTPTDSHPELVMAAARAGLDVLCEKPLATDSHVVQEMINTCKDHHVRLVPAMVGRYFDAYAVIHEQVANALLGDVIVQRFDRMGASPVAPWYHQDKRSGGLIFDQMIHDLDLARWIGGEVSIVHARESIAPAETGDRDPMATAPRQRSAIVTLTHRSGAVTTVTGTWGSSGTRFRSSCEITGSHGAVQHDSLSHPALVVLTDIEEDGAAPGSERQPQLLPDTRMINDPYSVQIKETYDYFRGGMPPRAAAGDALAAVRIAEAALDSVTSRRAVSIEEGCLR